jgi:hypothetical protein
MERFSGAVHVGADILNFFDEALQLGIASFNFLHSFCRALAECNHFRN